jgi:hypothetical protein
MYIWLDGVTTLAKLTGDHRVGKMLSVLLVVALTEEGIFFNQISTWWHCDLGQNGVSFSTNALLLGMA